MIKSIVYKLERRSVKRRVNFFKSVTELKWCVVAYVSTQHEDFCPVLLETHTFDSSYEDVLCSSDDYDEMYQELLNFRGNNER